MITIVESCKIPVYSFTFWYSIPPKKCPFHCLSYLSGRLVSRPFSSTTYRSLSAACILGLGLCNGKHACLSCHLRCQKGSRIVWQVVWWFIVNGILPYQQWAEGTQHVPYKHNLTDVSLPLLMIDDSEVPCNRVKGFVVCCQKCSEASGLFIWGGKESDFKVLFYVMRRKEVQFWNLNLCNLSQRVLKLLLEFRVVPHGITALTFRGNFSKY